jgi:hypothetical protein
MDTYYTRIMKALGSDAAGGVPCADAGATEDGLGPLHKNAEPEDHTRDPYINTWNGRNRQYAEDIE